MSGYRNMISTLLERAAPAALAPNASVEGTSVQPQASQPRPDSDPAPEKEKPMAINTESEDYKAGASASVDATKTAERARFTTVMTSEHYAGREALAANLLGTDMTAEAVVAALAVAPKASPAAEGDQQEQRSTEQSDQDLMRERLQTKNPDLGGDDDQDADAKAKASNHGWDKIHAEVEARRTANA